MDDGNMTFDDFLLQKYKLSPKLRSIVRYALAWETGATSSSLTDGMLTLRKHLQALGRYGTTAFLFPMYGSGELSQAFCRSAAVFGATYLLRRAPLAVEFLGRDGHKTVQGIILSPDTTSGEGDNEQGSSERLGKNKCVKCSKVVVPVNAVSASNFQKCTGLICGIQRIFRRISILTGSVILSENGEQRDVVFIPPHTIGNTHAIHGVLLDSSVSVAPKGCSLLHLTTAISVDPDSSSENIPSDRVATMLEKAEAAILKSKHLVEGEPSAAVLFHVSFSHDCPALSEITEISSSQNQDGLYFCHHSGQSLTADIAFEQAQNIFSSICPGMEFLGLSNTFDETIRERAEEKRYDDDEKVMLESALDMIEKPDSKKVNKTVDGASTTTNSTATNIEPKAQDVSS
jgi:hypothetical protein